MLNLTDRLPKPDYTTSITSGLMKRNPSEGTLNVRKKNKKKRNNSESATYRKLEMKSK